jgi:hypothetical protein
MRTTREKKGAEDEIATDDTNQNRGRMQNTKLLDAPAAAPAMQWVAGVY